MKLFKNLFEKAVDFCVKNDDGLLLLALVGMAVLLCIYLIEKGLLL